MDSTGTNSGGFLSSKSVFVQLFIGLSAGVVLYLFNLSVESFVKYMKKFARQRTVLLEDTYTSDGDSITITQNPNLPKSNSIYLSDNERTGPEFSYSFFINVSQKTFDGEEFLKHIFHKGYPKQYPLLCPGVYMLGHTNTMRVYMNTFKTWNNFIDVENIPINKWVHVVFTCSSSEINIFINANLTKKFNLDGFQIYQNYQDICVFSPYNIKDLNNPPVASLKDSPFRVKGHIDGMISRLKYFNYCLSYTEINELLVEGPSSRIMQSSSQQATPPYLTDNWWTTPY